MPRHWRDYVRPKRCKHCGHTRFYVDRERYARLDCRCSGAYPWPAHRPGSPMCEHNPQWQANRALRQGAGDEVVAALRKASTMSEQIGLEGVEEAPPITNLHVAVLGMLWKPARILAGDRMLEAWIVQPGSALPVFACLEDDNFRALVGREQRLQRVGTPVLARGFGLEVQCIEDRECLRIGLCSYLDVVPAEQVTAA